VGYLKFENDSTMFLKNYTGTVTLFLRRKKKKKKKKKLFIETQK